MTNPAIDEAIAKCDAILANIERIQAELRESHAKAHAAIMEAIEKVNNIGRVS